MPNDFFEKTLETIIMENQDIVVEKGFPAFYKHTHRQFILPNGCKLDILSYEITADAVLKCKIIELKRATCDLQALMQVLNYAKIFYQLTINYFNDVEIIPIVVGSETSEFISTMMAWGLKVNQVNYEYTVNGISFLELEGDGPFIKDFIRDKTEKNNKCCEDFSNFLKQKA
jgi:RecB family endonuclease NucS